MNIDDYIIIEVMKIENSMIPSPILTKNAPILWSQVSENPPAKPWFLGGVVLHSIGNQQKGSKKVKWFVTSCSLIVGKSWFGIFSPVIMIYCYILILFAIIWYCINEWFIMEALDAFYILPWKSACPFFTEMATEKTNKTLFNTKTHSNILM